MRLYSDLDETLISAVFNDAGAIVDVVVRPHVGWFLRTLAFHGDLWLLTAANRLHAMNSLRKIGAPSKLFRGILSYEDLERVDRRIDKSLNDPSLDPDERERIWRETRPIAPPGIIFDNNPVGSLAYFLKATAIGIGPESWIEVEPFVHGKRDRAGLREAYGEFLRRFSLSLAGPRRAALCR